MTSSNHVHIVDRRTPGERGRPFLPGMGKSWLLPAYDVLTRAAGVTALHQRAAAIAGVEAGQSVLDVGCGTGNLSFAVLAAEPKARVTGLDPDLAGLRLAARKARRRGVPLTLVQGYADRLPAEDSELDHVVSSLALHHVEQDGRSAFAREALRALRPGGTITIADFGGPDRPEQDADRAAHAHGPAHALRHLASLLPGTGRAARRSTVVGNFDGGIVDLLTQAGFADAREVDHLDHRFGRVSFVQATRP
ncbi:MAG TPA: class I SAM-dependent methyltransferase [Nocardioides sp.]